MHKNIIKLMPIAAALGVMSLPAQAGLIDRGGGMLYDDVLNITWLQDANYAKTSGYDGDGKMGWAAANTWAANLVYGGYDDWRLPTMTDTGASGCNGAYSGTDCGYNVQTTSGGTVYSELASLWYDTLGNKGYYNTSGVGPQAGWGLTSTGPFQNMKADAYWYGTPYAPDPATFGWYFATLTGTQSFYDLRINGFDVLMYALVVRDGDVAAPVPEPETYAMLLAGLGVLAAARRRRGRLGASVA